MSDTPRHSGDRPASGDSATDLDDTEAWLNALTGADEGAELPADPQLVRLRAAMHRHHESLDQVLLQDAMSDDMAWQRMQFRLRKEGLLQRSRAVLWWAPALAAALLMAVFLVQRSPEPDLVVASLSEPPSLRGGAKEAKVNQPLAEAKRLAAALYAIDPKVKLYWYKNVATIDFMLQTDEQILQAEEVLSKPPLPAGIRLQSGGNRLTLTAP